MTVLNEGEIEIFFFHIVNAGRLNRFEQHSSGIRIVEGVYQVSFATARTITLGSCSMNHAGNPPCDNDLWCNGLKGRRKIYVKIMCHP